MTVSITPYSESKFVHVPRNKQYIRELFKQKNENYNNNNIIIITGELLL